MKTIGLLGGMSWESTREYYRLINEKVRVKLGGLHSAEIIMLSVDFQPLASAMESGDWNTVREILVEKTRHMAKTGPELLLICTNTMHKFADDIAAASAPAKLIHIGECTADEARRRGYKKTALLGTRFTMEEDFYRAKLEAAGLEVLIPEREERELIDKLIFGELCAGIFKDESRLLLVEVTERLAEKGAEAVILGCTELPLILTPEESPLPILDTMKIHAKAAVKEALR
ncbi:MAG: aspartate/glutamate racemase family protein [Spirochaetaceae bacterium]|nr:aspartate/glutamate racemase family protein [Spirochaetaceae bacterium]